MKRAPSKDRKEQFCGDIDDVCDWIKAHDPKLGKYANAADSTRYEWVSNPTGPAYSVYLRRKHVDKTIKAPVRRLTREEFKTKGGKRPLWVSLDPGDVITFCPKGTRQRVTVPIASLYHFARFTAARALVAVRKAAKKAKK